MTDFEIGLLFWLGVFFTLTWVGMFENIRLRKKLRKENKPSEAEKEIW